MKAAEISRPRRAKKRRATDPTKAKPSTMPGDDMRAAVALLSGVMLRAWSVRQRSV